MIHLNTAQLQYVCLRDYYLTLTKCSVICCAEQHSHILVRCCELLYCQLCLSNILRVGVVNWIESHLNFYRRRQEGRHKSMLTRTPLCQYIKTLTPTKLNCMYVEIRLCVGIKLHRTECNIPLLKTFWHPANSMAEGMTVVCGFILWLPTNYVSIVSMDSL